ncbi:MAG: M14 family zinc carboxypeptidase [Bacteroidales bacterium]|nr:M14 family zinc carboxypeptidase [Bacteroidales bacterium]
MEQIQKKHPEMVSILHLTSTPGGRPLYMIQIGNRHEKTRAENPSIFVAANLEGNRPLATEGAVFLAETLLSDPVHTDSLNWYILPLGNPDAASGFFESPLAEDSRNDLPTNDDMDDLTDEDGVNDLNGDGWITKMRQVHPDGEWIISDTDPRLMQKADPKKGEQGVYKLYSEGTDGDGDGKYNEDGPGGTNVGLNFPQLFKHYTSDGGLFPGSSPEAYALMKFVFEHPGIAMIVSFGSTNWCYKPPIGGRKGEKDLNKIRLTERQARQFSLDQNRTYSLTELLEILKSGNPQMQMDESALAGYLGLGAALNPQEGDLLFYEKYAEAYKSYLKEQGAGQERTDPAPAKDGSLELWGYFQVGVPVFSLDLWGLSKIDSANLEETLLAYSDSQPGQRGFVEWEPFDHPSLGSVEIGGFIPYLETTPPYEWTDSLLNLHIPWILKLAGELPDLHIYEVRTTSKGKGIYQLDIWIENRAFIPFPTNMGNRNRQPAPAVLSLEGEALEFISGYPRIPIGRVDGNSRVKTTWIIQMEKPGSINLKLESKTAGHDQLTINIGG